jgi:uncharacterized protein (TIGR02145 family)
MENSIINDLIDFSGNVYPIVTIGNQRWLARNLATKQFLNGDIIPFVSDPVEWEKYGQEGLPACCWYENNQALEQNYGLLYNWFAVADPRGIAPSDSRVALLSDWMELTTHAGGEHIAGRKIKNITGWDNFGNGSNQFGFNAMPGGGRGIFGSFLDLGEYANWWTPEHNEQDAFFVYTAFSNSNLFIRKDGFKASGLSVRCILN